MWSMVRRRYMGRDCGSPVGRGTSVQVSKRGNEVSAQVSYSTPLGPELTPSSSDLRIHTVHASDVAAAMYLISLYLLSTPRETVLSQSGVSLPFSFSPPPSSTFSLGSKRNTISDNWKTIKGVVPEGQSVTVPMFNIVDEGDTTQESLAKVVADVWGVEYGFLNSTVASLVQQFAKVGCSPRS